ncbi:class II myosin, partial [Kickxella alabastrina]
SAAARCVLVCRAGGCLGLLAAAVQPAARPSEGLRDAVADTFLALAAVPALRGLLAQQGGVRCLLRHLLTADAPKARAAKALPSALLQGRDRCVAFALAKIAISVPPHLAFDDPREIARLLLALLAEESDAQALLMRFEALLALTNLASAPPGSSHDVRGYLANDLDGISLVELVLLSDHVLVRRAATELVCNLVYDEAVFERFAKGADTHVPADEFTPGIVELPSDAEGDGADSDGAGYRSQRLHLLVALADVDDAATRSAAAGALAVLTSDPRCCRYLFLVHPRAGDVILGLLAVEDGVGDEEAAAFRHRVAVIWANAVSCGDRSVVARLGADDGVVAALREMTADAELPYYAAAKSALDQLF